MTDNRVALVTGGSYGIGLATVAALAGRGIKVVAAARNRERLEAAISELGELAGSVAAMACDVTRAEQVQASVEETLSRFGRLDILVNSAGVSQSANRPIVDSELAEWRRIIETNLTGTYLMCRQAMPLLQASDDGWLINIQSTASYKATPGVGVYAASKFGVRALTEALIEEHRNGPVRITSISPGPVDTNIWTHKREPPSAERRSKMLRPSDIADIVTFLIDRPHHMHIPNITVTPWTGI
jgi:NADP-dependent 3-hydroxy acid dehydrogenase YdfG